MVKLKLKEINKKKSAKSEKKEEKTNKAEENPFEDKDKFSSSSLIEIPTSSLKPQDQKLEQLAENFEPKPAQQPAQTALPTPEIQYSGIRKRVENAPMYSAPNIMRESREVIEESRRTGAFVERKVQSESRLRAVDFENPDMKWVQGIRQADDYVPSRPSQERIAGASPISSSDFKGKRELVDRQYEEG